MERYEKYRDSGIEWIGEIPEHWEVGKLTHNVYLRHGFQFRDFDFTPSGIKIIKITQLKQNGQLDIEENISFIDSTRLDEFKDILIEKGDILMALTGGTIGKIIRVEEVCEPLLQNYRVGNFFPLKSNLEKGYLFWVLSSNIILEQIFYDIRENGQPNIGKENFSRMFMPLPNQKEVQTAITSYLDCKTTEIDTIIANKQRLITLYEEEKQAIINLAVTKGLDPNVKMKPSGVEWLGDIPEHWEVKKLKHILSSIVGGGTPSTANPLYWDGEIPWVSAKDMKQDYLNHSEDYITELGVKESSTTYIEDEQVIIVVRSGILKHTFPVAINKIPISINQDLKALKPIDTVLNGFMFWKLKGLSNEILTYCNKMGATVDSIDMSFLMDLPFTFPLKNEQQGIIDYIEGECTRLDTIIDKFKKQIDLFQEYRTTLISEVVTGKLKV
jgi:type I restriction enzyme S subunit